MLTVLDITAPLPHIELQLEKKWNSRLTDHSKVFLLLFLLARSLFFVDAFCLIQVVKKSPHTVPFYNPKKKEKLSKRNGKKPHMTMTLYTADGAASPPQAPPVSMKYTSTRKRPDIEMRAPKKLFLNEKFLFFI